MKYHFIYPDVGTDYYPSVHHGLAQLASILKTDGKQVSLHHVRKEPKPTDILKAIDREKPDIIGFTAMSNQIGYVRLWSKWIKGKYDIPIVCGGVHATLCPEELLDVDSVDAVCVGEGDRAILDSNFWVKQNGNVAKGKPYPLVENLDELPFPDYGLFDIGGMMRARNGNFAVMVSRGCPFQCAYCSNHALRESQKGLGRYFRYRSVDNTIALLKDLVGKYPIKSFSFADDIFGINRKWVFEFCEKYPKVIGLPFECNLRVETATKELLKALKSANCIKVEFGIESGNEKMRREILNRQMSNQQIIDAFENAHKLGIKTRAYNMVGLPYETVDMIKETIDLNRRVNPDQIGVFYFYPFKGTKLREVCEKEGWLDGKETTSYISQSILNLPTISKKELKSLHSEFYRLMINQELKSYNTVMRLMLKVVVFTLKILTNGNEGGIIRGMYLKLFPILQALKGSK